jgi:hypothetical protein
MVEKKCSTCGMVFLVHPYRADMARRCSIKCEAEYRKSREYRRFRSNIYKRPTVPTPIRKFIKCSVCNKEISKWKKSHIRTHCDTCIPPRKNIGYSEFLESLRQSKLYKSWRASVYSKDKGICQICGKKCRKNITAHHIKRFKSLVSAAILEFPIVDKLLACEIYKPLWEVSNGVTLCRECHGKLHTKEGHKIRWGTLKYDDIMA